MVMKILIVFVCVLGIPYLALKLVREISPKGSGLRDNVEKAGETIFGCISGLMKGGKEVVSNGENVLDGLEKFVGTSLPKNFQVAGRDSKEVIQTAKEMLGKVREFMDGPSKLESEPVLKFLLSTITERGSIFKDFVDGNIYVITDDPDHPFRITSVISEVSKKVVKGIDSNEEKARAIFTWIDESIKYDFEKCDRIRKGEDSGKYRTSTDVFNDKSGVCGEMAVLNVVMLRSVGLKSSFVKVHKDHTRKEVEHACASVKLNGKDVLSDPAYHIFDIAHVKFEIVSDYAGMIYFKGLRN